jgi:hypothetical protein
MKWRYFFLSPSATLLEFVGDELEEDQGENDE